MELTGIRTEGVDPLIIDRRACGGGMRRSRNHLIATHDRRILCHCLLAIKMRGVSGSGEGGEELAIIV